MYNDIVTAYAEGIDIDVILRYFDITYAELQYIILSY